MEKKTIGGFIAALRKANGMTQKDLAERLHVSDKTVSRWERDDGAPDLAVIPVIAEIFGVTCDELLRGERKPPAERAEPAEQADPAPKAEKQRQRLLKLTLSQYKSRTYIAMGISVLGVIAALICDLAFLKALLGFFLGAVFFAGSVVCQAVFVNKAFFSVEDAGLDESKLSDFKRSVIRAAERSIGLTAALLGFTLPLLLADAGMGLTLDSLLLWGAVGAIVLLLVYAVALYFLHAALLRKGVYALPEKEAAVYHRNHKLKRTCAIALAAVLAVTFVAHQFATSIWGPYSIMKGTTFADYDSFIQYMEQDIPAGSDGHAGEPKQSAVQNPYEGKTYYDASGNVISEEEALTRRLEDSNGDVVCEYIDRNENVVSLRYTPKDGTILPITVCTEDDLRAAQQTAAARHVLFGAAYCLECLIVIVVYIKNRAK